MSIGRRVVMPLAIALRRVLPNSARQSRHYSRPHPPPGLTSRRASPHRARCGFERSEARAGFFRARIRISVSHLFFARTGGAMVHRPSCTLPAGRTATCAPGLARICACATARDGPCRIPPLQPSCTRRPLQVIVALARERMHAPSLTVMCSLGLHWDVRPWGGRC